MSIELFACAGGAIYLPTRDGALVSREDGGNLIVFPSRRVWERSELTLEELRNWSCLVAAAGAAMLKTLPQLDGGCINYWEAGNWALNPLAPPEGDKRAPDHRSMHLHLLGRSRTAKDPNWRWGESPVFPRYAERNDWLHAEDRLAPAETSAIVNETARILADKYGFAPADIGPVAVCPSCSYPTALKNGAAPAPCVECAAQ
ncbi:hypothetical protein [Hyphococcus sp.]|jgi:hypothetical protein|uniref:hypothetical protein n=1 Tax=Hyphococcus sp. TaxID=2038636 RepID=UPI003D13F8CA